MNRLTGRTIAVLGGDGFIGSHLAQALATEGAQVRALCRRYTDGSLGCLEHMDPATRCDVDVRIGRVTDASLVTDLLDGADTAYYAEAHRIAAPGASNTDGPDDHAAAAMTLLAAMDLQRVGRAIWAWTGDHARPPAWVATARRATGSSIISMIATQRILATFGERGAPLVRVAPCAVYGPRQPVDALLPTMLSQLDTWMDPVTIPGPVPRQEYVYIDDLVEALVLAAHLDPAAYELRTGATLSVNEVFAACCEVMQAQAGLTYRTMPLGPPLDGVDDDLLAGAGARRLPGWAPRVSLDEGVRRTADWLFPARSPGVAWSA